MIKNQSDHSKPLVSDEKGEPKNLWMGFLAVMILAGKSTDLSQNVFSEASVKLDQENRRAQLLVAYRARHSWKKSDVSRLESLGVSVTAQNRMNRLTGRGRPTVKRVQPVGQDFLEKVYALQIILDPTSTPDKRKREFKNSPWWQHYVEALYRGEHMLAKQREINDASGYAEHLVGCTLGMSAAKIHKICGEIRGLRTDWEGAADFPSMTLQEYEDWMKTGQLARWEK